MAEPIRITADEINCLIYSYLQDSGFTHSAFAICMEGRLEQSPHFTKHIPRGELIELLSKALLYTEVESHWKGDAMTTNCQTGFSLLETHVCSLDLPAMKLSPKLQTLSDDSEKENANAYGVAVDVPAKRKASPHPSDAVLAEKRPKRDREDMDVDTHTESVKEKTADEISNGAGRWDSPIEPLLSKKPSKPKPRVQGPADDATSPKAVKLLQGHKAEVFVCTWNPVKHQLLATGSKDGAVNLWTIPEQKPPDLSDSDVTPSYPPPTVIDFFSKTDQCDLTSMHWSTDGTLLAVGSYDSVLRICKASGELYFSHPQHQGPLFSTRFSKSGRWLLTASLDGTACLWDVKEKRLHRQYRCHTDCCLDVVWLNDDTFASCGVDQVIHVMRVDESEPVKTLIGHQNEVNQIKCNSSGTRLASCSDDGTARVWNVDNIFSSAESIPGLVASDHVVVLDGHRHSVSFVSWCPDHPPGTNQMIATSSFDGTARLWDSVTGECLKRFLDHKRPVYTLSFSPNGKWLATGSGDGWLHVYNVGAKEKRWSWYAGPEKPGVFEIDWQQTGDVNRICVALESRQVGVIDVAWIPALQDHS